VATVSSAGSPPDHADDLRDLASVLSDAANIDKRIEDSFRNQVGKKVSVRLVSGTRTLVIQGVKDGEVRGSETLRMRSTLATVSRDFKLADLSLAEKLGRMGRDDDPAVALVKGALAYCAQSQSYAKKYFASAPHAIRQKLLDKLESASAAAAPVEVADAPPVVEPVPPAPVNPQPNAPPAAADNIDGFIEKLIATNPELDSERIQLRKGRSGEVISVTVRRAPELRDLSALASLKSLREFNYFGDSRNVAPIRDLTPLAGLPLVSLKMSHTKLVSAEPIKSMMSLKHLSLTQCPLKDIKPLQALQLESIDLSGTRVFEFSHITRMPLKSFAANSTALKNPSFLRGMHLESVSLADTPVYDFSVLAQMPIKALNVSDTQFKYLEPFKKWPLKTLRANNSKITNLRTLNSFAKTLTVLELNNVKAAQFDAMANLNKLTHLSLADTQFSDPALLSSMKLVSLNLNRTKVDSIDALNPGALKVLRIEDTDVDSIATLQGCELDRFYCKGAPIKNYRPIYGAPIRYMSINRPASMKQLYGNLPKLTIVNGRNIHKQPQWN
jgi:Leucine-rich repeat (LRR) protein